jgi:hypothetical protein
VAEEVVDITIVAEEEEINIILAVVVGMVAECSNSSRMINTIKEVAEVEAVAEEVTTNPTIRAMVTSTKADTAVELEGGDIGAVEVRTLKNAVTPPPDNHNFYYLILNSVVLIKHIILLTTPFHYPTFHYINYRSWPSTRWSWWP